MDDKPVTLIISDLHMGDGKAGDDFENVRRAGQKSASPLGSLSDVCQIFQTDQTVGVPGHDAFGDHMIGVLLQPSLSSADRPKATGCRTSAFFCRRFLSLA